jgi:RHS repeat-associated protein
VVSGEEDSRAGAREELLLLSGFTGKEDDLAVGVTYFGKRYLVPALGRWASADPLAVHVPGQADLNLYAYVRAQVLRATDPTGLIDQGTGSNPGVEQGDQAYSPNPGVGGTSIAPQAATSGYETTGRGDVEADARAHHENALGMVKHDLVADSVMRGAVKEYGRHLKSETPDAVRLGTQTLLGEAGASLVATVTEHALSRVKIPENANSAEDLGSLAFVGAQLTGPVLVSKLAREGGLARRLLVDVEGALSPSRALHNATSGSSEIVRRFESLVDARSAARAAAGLGDDAVPFVQKLGPFKGRITGMQSSDGKTGWRVDWDANKQFHVNWWDKTGGSKRPDWKTGANIVEGGTEDAYLQFMQHVP